MTGMVGEAYRSVKDFLFVLRHAPSFHLWKPVPQGIPCWVTDPKSQTVFEARLLKISKSGVKIALEKYLNDNEWFEIDIEDVRNQKVISMRVQAVAISTSSALFRPFRLLFSFTSRDYFELMARDNVEAEFYCIFSPRIPIPPEYVTFYRNIQNGKFKK